MNHHVSSSRSPSLYCTTLDSEFYNSRNRVEDFFFSHALYAHHTHTGQCASWRAQLLFFVFFFSPHARGIGSATAFHQETRNSARPGSWRPHSARFSRVRRRYCGISIAQMRRAMNRERSSGARGPRILSPPTCSREAVERERKTQSPIPHRLGK